MIHHLEDGTYKVTSHHGPVPGVYEDERAARYASRFSDQDLESLPAGVITSTNLFELWMDHLKKQGRCRCKKP